ncbi:MAG: DUF2157 domain-containing protein [Actinomycetota bacterium]
MARNTDLEPAERLPGKPSESQILRRVGEWTKEGLITPEQAAAIREFEGAGGEGGPKRVPPIIQALLYMGTALALAGLATIYWRLYEDLPYAARVATPALVAVALAAGGWFTARRTDRDVRRFGGVLWLLSTGGIAGFMSELLMPDELAGDWSLFWVGAGAAVWAGVLARLSPQATTQIGLFIPTVAVVVGFPMALTHGFANEPDVAWLAPALGGLGAGWIVAGRTGAVRPTAVADLLGGAFILWAPTFLFAADMGEGVPLLLGSVLAGGLLGASTWLRSPALLAVGAVGLYAYSFRALWVYFGDTIGMPVVLLIGGLLLVAIAFGSIRLSGRRGR